MTAQTLTTPTTIELKHDMGPDRNIRHLLEELGVTWGKTSHIIFPVGTIYYPGERYTTYYGGIQDEDHQKGWGQDDLYLIHNVLISIVWGEYVKSDGLHPDAFARMHIPSSKCYHIIQKVREDRGIPETVMNLRTYWFKHVHSFDQTPERFD
jgi:hypothetical protein